MYIVTRSDLSFGTQVVQASHAVAEYCSTPESTAWKESSNSIIVLNVDTEKELWWLNRHANAKGIQTYEFREPDFCNELTAVAFAPGDATRRLLSSLPCAGKNPAPEGAQARERSLRSLSEEMQACEQFPGMGMLDHGIAVVGKFWELWNYLETGIEPQGWRIPCWMTENKDKFLALEPHLFEIEKYMTIHDCGKPEAFANRTETQKFPNHAEVSRQVWSRHSDDLLVLDLIADDMLAHTMKAANVEAFASNPNYLILLLSALAEIHANCEMFGGMESTSFKIKWKQLDKRGRQVLQCADASKHS